MAKTDQQVIAALVKAAEALVGRTLKQDEANDLVARFNKADGTFRDKANRSLRGFTGLNEQEIRVKVAASDNTDRVMTDMQNTLDDWKPGT